MIFISAMGKKGLGPISSLTPDRSRLCLRRWKLDPPGVVKKDLPAQEWC